MTKNDEFVTQWFLFKLRKITQFTKMIFFQPKKKEKAYFYTEIQCTVCLERLLSEVRKVKAQERQTRPICLVQVSPLQKNCILNK